MAEQDLSRPYVGYRSAGRRPESQQDRTASANAPLSALRGYVASTLGLPGDIEGLGRMLIPGVSEQSYLPDSEYFRKVLPMRELEQTPIGSAFTEAGGLAGGAGLMTAGKVAGKGAMAAGRAGERMAEKYVPKIMERGGVGADILQGMSKGTISPMDVYHGSPHKFDRFDSSRIGTGEGAQSYGHGLYLAENPSVATGYKKSTSYQDSVRQFRKELPDDADFDELMDIVSSGGLSQQSSNVIKELANNDWLGFDYPSQAITAAFKNLKNYDATPELKAAIDNYGSLYKVDLPDNQIAKMLDWDKPLSQQPEVIKALKGTDYEVGISQKEAEKLADMQLSNEASDWADMTGGDPVDYINNANWEKIVDQIRKESGSIDSNITGKELHRMVMRDEGYRPDLFDPENYQVGTSETLRNIGIPGIRYLDGGSRGAGEGTSNFVVFPGEEKSLKILERDGKPMPDPTEFAQGGPVSLNQLAARYAKGGEVDEDTLDTFVAPSYRKQRATPSSKETKEAMAEVAKFGAEMLIPQTLFDAGLMLIPGGRLARKAGAALIALDAGEAQASPLTKLLKAFHGASRPIEGTYDVSKASERSIMGKGLNVSTDPAYPSRWAMHPGSLAPTVYETAVPIDKYIQLDATYPQEAFDVLRKVRGRNPLPEGEVTGEQVYQSLRGLPQSMIPDVVLKSGYKGVEYPAQDKGRWFSIYDTEGVKDRLGKKFADGGPVSLDQLAARYDKGGAVKAGIKKIISLFDDGEEALAKLDAGEKLSKAENIAAGLYHPIGEGKKLNVPFSRMTSTVVDNPNVIMHKGKIITPEQAVKERMGFFPLIGDRADTGKILTHVNERKAKYETPLTGGGKYMQANYDPVMEKSAGWESGKGKVGTLRNRISDIVESGYQPVGVFSPGSHVQVDFNTMMPHALLGQFDPTDTTKKLIKQFDKEVKAAYPNWVGITHPQAEAQLMDKGNGVLRTQFTKTMGKDSYQSSGFPDVPSVRKAISDPELYNTELGTLGQNMALFDRTGALVEVPKNPSAYPLSMSAQNLGKLDQTENFADFFTTANERRRLMGSDPAGDYRSFELSQPIQYANEEWLNKLLESRRLRDEAIKKGGYAEGGSVNSPATYDPSLIDEIVSSIDEPTGYAEGGSVRMAQGGSVSAYDSDLVDAIANQFM